VVLEGYSELKASGRNKGLQGLNDAPRPPVAPSAKKVFEPAAGYFSRTP
jgi:hypothetical protein